MGGFVGLKKKESDQQKWDEKRKESKNSKKTFKDFVRILQRQWRINFLELLV